MKFRLSILAASLAISSVAHAATEIDLRKQPSTYIENILMHQTKDSNVKIETTRVDVDFNGTSHTRIKQTYKGIPVWGATGVIHAPEGRNLNRKTTLNLKTMNGIVYESLEKDLAQHAPVVFSKEMALKSLQHVKDLHQKKYRNAIAKTQDEQSTPIIYIDENKQAHYAFLVSYTYYLPSAAHRPTTIVDAVTHHVYRSWEGIFTLNEREEQAVKQVQLKVKNMLKKDEDDDEMPFPFIIYPITAGGIGGNSRTGEVFYDGEANHKPLLNMTAIEMELEIIPGQPNKIVYCVMQDEDISVLDVAKDNAPVYAFCPPSKQHNLVNWLSTDKNYTRWYDDEMNDGYSPSLDALYAAQMTKKMYQEWLNVPALIDITGNPMRIIIRTHFGRNFDNAFWDGKQVTFGDGGKIFYPLASMSVTAHEMSHGFTETYSGIDTSHPQMGALHESFSDMAAIAVENHLTGTNKWEIGRDIKKDDGALRYLDTPTKDGHSIDHMKDFDETEVHSAAGIPNKAFYLLATTKGWDVRKAFSVMAKANMHYWTSSMSTLSQAACGVVSATKDYNYDVADVRVAFSKVGIDTDNCEEVNG